MKKSLASITILAALNAFAGNGTGNMSIAPGSQAQLKINQLLNADLKSIIAPAMGEDSSFAKAIVEKGKIANTDTDYDMEPAPIFMLYNPNAPSAMLTCDIINDSDEAAGLPLSQVRANLNTQVTTLVQHWVDASGKPREALKALISEALVSTIVPTKRDSCQIVQVSDQDEVRGWFRFTCNALVVTYRYDRETGLGIYSEELGSINRKYNLKNCQ